MSELIKREDVIARIEKWAVEYKEQHPTAKRISISPDDVIKMVKEIPVASVPTNKPAVKQTNNIQQDSGYWW